MAEAVTAEVMSQRDIRADLKPRRARILELVESTELHRG